MIQNDSAKNFAIDAMAGIRYMLLKNISAFVEYKYNHQFSPEMEISSGAGQQLCRRGNCHSRFL